MDIRCVDFIPQVAGPLGSCRFSRIPPMNDRADETIAAAEQRWLEVVREKVRAIRFGSVLVTVHEGRVTQVESVEKTRIDPERPEDRGPGGKRRA